MHLRSNPTYSWDTVVSDSYGVCLVTTHTCLMYMQPNTLHYVLTPQAAICHGGHFYAMSTICDTVFGLYHMFVLSNFITNVKHSQASHLLLQRLIMHTHNALVVGGVDA